MPKTCSFPTCHRVGAPNSIVRSRFPSADHTCALVARPQHRPVTRWPSADHPAAFEPRGLISLPSSGVGAPPLSLQRSSVGSWPPAASFVPSGLKAGARCGGGPTGSVKLGGASHSAFITKTRASGVSLTSRLAVA